MGTRYGANRQERSGKRPNRIRVCTHSESVSLRSSAQKLANVWPSRLIPTCGTVAPVIAMFALFSLKQSSSNRGRGQCVAVRLSPQETDPAGDVAYILGSLASWADNRLSKNQF